MNLQVLYCSQQDVYISQNHKTCSDTNVSKFQPPNLLERLLKKVQAKKKVTTYVLIYSLYNTPYNATSYIIYVNTGLTTSLSMLQFVRGNLKKIYMTIATIQYYNRLNIVYCFLIINNQHFRSLNQLVLIQETNT